MAEGGYEFDNPVFKIDDYDDDDYDDEEKTPLMDNDDEEDVLGVDDYKISDYLKEGRSMFQDFQRTIKAPIRELDNIEIPLQEISTQQEGQELLEIASNAETHVKEIETSFIEQWNIFSKMNETQTKMTKKRDGWYNQCNDNSKRRD
ncbi:Hypothetical predicted protein [Mytilus galloprovincialis]|uniref:Uncharacterized protein n=1 Tax=Mytilus galloprovincialis TaxID=29158 RepID=A0A8B6G555_MYTGA|nr:Hypothetical predicted protein [Mytilus galloprovincialis]